ncbi:MAG: methyltransferase domain-containing protein [Gammaproteobacteria bacterium]
MDYQLQQHGRASIRFLTGLRSVSDRYEPCTDKRAQQQLDLEQLPGSPEKLQSIVASVIEQDPEFRLLRMCRDWTLEQHGQIAMDAFDEIRSAVEPGLKQLQSGTSELTLDQSLNGPDYWNGIEFHKSTGGWDGHDYMGFVHGELIHNRMVNSHFAGIIYAVRKSVAVKAAEYCQPEKILETGCCSGQYTKGIHEVFPESEIHACDLSAKQLEQAQRFANEQGYPWKLFQAAGENLSVADNEYDLVTSYAMFHEIPTTAASANLAEYLRVLKPGGYAVIGDVKAYHAYEPYDRWKNDYWNQVHGGDPYWREYADTNLADLALAAGFAEASWEGLGEGRYPFVLVARKAG